MSTLARKFPARDMANFESVNWEETDAEAFSFVSRSNEVFLLRSVVNDVNFTRLGVENPRGFKKH